MAMFSQFLHSLGGFFTIKNLFKLSILHILGSVYTMKTQANSFLYALVRDALKHIFLYMKYTKTRALSVILKVYCGFFKNRCQETACLQARGRV